MTRKSAVLGAANLAQFVTATAGRNGTVQSVHGGLVVASPIDVVNGYVNALIPTEVDAIGADVAQMLDEATAFFHEQSRSFVVWALESSAELVGELIVRGAERGDGSAPAMVARQRVTAGDSELTVRTVEGVADRVVFGDLVERGYDKPGLGWLHEHHGSYDAGGTTWAIVSDGDVPLGVAGGFFDPSNSDTGGIYYVATPPENRGRGAGAAVTAWMTNHLFYAGASSVVLQSSEAGFPIYKRLGFESYDSYVRFTISHGA
jgi:ribosomal protein S18 acetylase RimI-like enzyme